MSRMFGSWSVSLVDALVQVNNLHLKQKAYEVLTFLLLLKALFHGLVRYIELRLQSQSDPELEFNSDTPLQV